MHPSMNPHWYAVIMAGGAGTRFWPASRRLRPKQLLALGPRADESLIQATVRRLTAILPADRILIATGAHLASATSQALGSIPPGNILAEPAARNTAPCIGWATSSIVRRDPDAIVAVLSADHLAEDESAFCATISHAMQVASSGVITTIGIVPTRPETGYGYIEVGPKRPDGAHDGLRFVEKPDLPRAQSMVQSQRFLWNSGFFFFRASQMMEAIGTWMPDLGDAMRRIDDAAAHGREAEALQAIFPSLPSVSIDVGVMEKLPKLAVVPGDFGWTDVGSWQTVWELALHDADGNAAPPGSVLVDSRGNYVSNLSSDAGRSKLIALVGVQDLVVVETDDALLVMPRSRSQDVRLVVAALTERGEHNKL
jgi:mannose-1-phosphate guanylyltransferase